MRSRQSVNEKCICVMFLLGVFLICSFPSYSQTDAEVDYCNIPSCSNLIPGPLYTESFETSLRDMYAKIPFIGGNPDNLDLDFDGMKDTAQARLFDTIMSTPSIPGIYGIPTQTCIYWAYVANRVKVEALALAINAGWPSYLGSPPDLEGMKTFFAALSTMGNTGIINTVITALGWIIPNLPDLSLLELNGSNIVYLNAKGDADLDGICNIGEYKAWVINTPADFDAFVNAATDSGVTEYYGGCPSCGTEGTIEGDGEGSVGPPPCDMRSDENYYALLVMFGDTDKDGKLSKSELKAFVTGFLLDLGWRLIDKDGDGYLSFEEFAGSYRLGSLLPADLDDDGNNQVTLSEIQQLSSKITQATFDEFDIDDNGYLDCVDIRGPVPDSCYADWCWQTCSSTPVSSGFETALRGLYNIASFLGVNPDTVDLDGNGLADVAQARLLDYVLAHPEQPMFCCVRNAYMNNRVVAQNKWQSIPLIGYVFPNDTFVNVLAGVLTIGEQSFIDSIVGVINTLLGIFGGELTLNEYDLTAGQYLASNGDPDFDEVCNLGEYNAIVTDPQNYDAFVLTALDINQTTDGGGCTPCPGTYEGEAPCDIADYTHYYYVLIMFGDTDGNGLLSKEEFKAITGLSDIVLTLWGLVDSNGDNQLSLDEFSSVKWIYDLLVNIDSDNDDILTLSELQGLNSSITQEQLNAVDLNQNGLLDCYDFEPYFQEGEGTPEGTPEGEGIPEGTPEGVAEGIPEGVVEGIPEGVIEGIPEGTPEGIVEGEGVFEGTPEGVVEGEPISCDIDDITHYYAILIMFGDTDNNGMISKSELKSITGWSDIIIAPLWLLVDSNKDNQLSLDEFVKVQSIFNLLPGLDSNNDNILTLDELHGLNSNITADQLNAVDKNLNGVLDCEDFLPSIEGEGSIEGVIEGVVEGIPEGTPEGVVEGTPEGIPEGVVEGTPEGIPEGVVEGTLEGIPEGIVEGTPEGIPEGVVEGIPEGIPEGVVEGIPEGVNEGEIPEGMHSSDTNHNWKVELRELLRVIQLFNFFGYHCDSSTEDGFAPGTDTNLRNCLPHTSDYNPQDWRIDLRELLRLIQIFNIGGYRLCPDQEDGFCPGLN